MTRENESERRVSEPDDDIRRWFRALPPPRTGQVPAFLRANVLAHIDQRRARRTSWAWWWPRQPLSWVLVGAVVLLCSLSVNIWWGVHRLGQHQAAAGQRFLEPLAVYRFQADSAHVQALGPLAARRPLPRDTAVGLAFAPQLTPVPFLRLGTVYADALASLRSAAPESALPQVDRLMHLLHSLQAPETLVEHLQHVQTLARSQRYPGAQLAKLLALFEPLYAMEYRLPEETEAWTFFQAGAWLENMLLATLVGDTMVLKQASAVLDLRTALARFAVPPEVLTQLEALHHLVQGQELTARRTGELLQRLQSLQHLLEVIPE